MDIFDALTELAAARLRASALAPFSSPSGIGCLSSGIRRARLAST